MTDRKVDSISELLSRCEEGHEFVFWRAYAMMILNLSFGSWTTAFITVPESPRSPLVESFSFCRASRFTSDSWGMANR